MLIVILPTKHGQHVRFLQYYPECDDWPPEMVCKVIDTINSEELNIGFRVSTSNKHSFSSRSPYEGGNRERILAEHYKKLYSKISINYPVTASILKGISDEYSQQAIKEDERAEQDKLGI